MARDLFSRDITTTENERGVHGTTQESISDSAPFSVHTFMLQGDYNELKALRDKHSEVLPAYQHVVAWQPELPIATPSFRTSTGARATRLSPA